MPLSHSQTRRFVVVLVALMIVLSVVATVMITRGWANDDVQEQVRDKEAERRDQMPRL